MNIPPTEKLSRLRISDRTVPLDQIIAVAETSIPVEISGDTAYLKKLEDSVAVVNDFIERDQPIYGVTTGYGSSCGNRFSARDIDALAYNLIQYHGCGTGEFLSPAQSRAAMLCRLICLAKGYSGISLDLLDQLAAFLNHGITPLIPSEGSVGASGDLTPLSYIAACLTGEREVIYKGERMPAGQAIQEAGLEPYQFRPKEPLALMNGTSVMTGIAALALARAGRILEAATSAAALCVYGLKGHSHHYHATILEAKPFAGQARVGARLLELLDSEAAQAGCSDPDSFQDPYSIRCAPQVLGVLADAMQWIGPWVETEANSANDNPIIDVPTGQILMGGNFYGGHIAFAMDGLKTALASLCDLCDRQIALLIDPRFSRGLPANLIVETTEDAKIYHGYKGLQITASALAAEIQKLAIPAAVFSRSTESHNQDKVSLGTIAARDADKICSLSEKVAAIHLLVGSRACQLRKNVESYPALSEIINKISSFSEPYLRDRPMDKDIDGLAKAVGKGLV